MSFGEKTAWVMGAIMIIAGAAYVNIVAKPQQRLETLARLSLAS